MSDQTLDIAPTPGYSEPYATLLSTLRKSTNSWRHDLEGITVEEIVWQPYPNGHSIGAILLHMAEVEAYWIETVGSGRELTAEEREAYLSDDTDALEGVWPTPPRESIEYYLGLLNRVRAQTLESVKAFGDPATAKDAGWGTMTLRWLLAHVIWHESYHGGQIVLLRKLWARMG